MAEYQSTISEMERRIEELGGDSPALTGGRLPKQLVAELDAEKAAKLAIQQGLLVPAYIWNHINILIQTISSRRGTGRDG